MDRVKVPVIYIANSYYFINAIFNRSITTIMYELLTQLSPHMVPHTHTQTQTQQYLQQQQCKVRHTCTL